MAVISGSTLALLRRIKEEAMLDTVVIHGPSTRTVTDLPSGGWEVNQSTAAPVATRGMVQALSKTAIDRLIADRIEPTGMEQVDLPLSTSVTTEDTLTITSARHGTTTKYDVKSVPKLETYSVSRPVIVKAVS